MGRTVPTSNQGNSLLIGDMRKIRDGLTTRDKKLWDEFMTTGHLNERATPWLSSPTLTRALFSPCSSSSSR